MLGWRLTWCVHLSGSWSPSGPSRRFGAVYNELRFLSYGGGVQTRAAVQLILRGEIARPDAAFFGDTLNEPKAIYDAVADDWVALDKIGIPFYRCIWGNLATPPYGVHAPLYTLAPNGKKGQLFRTCTDRFKIRPIRQQLRKLGCKRAFAWLGITKDEIERVKPSDLLWYTHEYPLLDYTRTDCEEILAQVGIEPVKSACTFCPYRSQDLWETLHGDDLASAIAYDESIRHVRPGFLSFVHSARVPLTVALAKHIATQHDGEGCPTSYCFS